MKMTKIAEAFQNKKAFIGFLTAGDPSLECTEEFIIKMEEAGALNNFKFEELRKSEFNA